MNKKEIIIFLEDTTLDLESKIKKLESLKYDLIMVSKANEENMSNDKPIGEMLSFVSRELIEMKERI
jgi:hypothetical protein